MRIAGIALAIGLVGSVSVAACSAGGGSGAVADGGAGTHHGHPPGGTGWGPVPGTGGAGLGRANRDTCDGDFQCASLHCASGTCAAASGGKGITLGQAVHLLDAPGMVPEGGGCFKHSDCAVGRCVYTDDQGDAACTQTSDELCGSAAFDFKSAMCCSDGASGSTWLCPFTPNETCQNGEPCFPTCAKMCKCNVTGATTGRDYGDSSKVDRVCLPSAHPGVDGGDGGDDGASDATFPDDAPSSSDAMSAGDGNEGCAPVPQYDSECASFPNQPHAHDCGSAANNHMPGMPASDCVPAGGMRNLDFCCPR